VRSGIDRDLDAVLDGDDNCPAVANPLQEDDNSDGIGNACDPLFVPEPTSSSAWLAAFCALGWLATRRRSARARRR
jgi:hypothetical protein